MNRILYLLVLTGISWCVEAGRPRKKRKLTAKERQEAIETNGSSITDFFKPAQRERLFQPAAVPIDDEEEAIDDLFDDELDLPQWAGAFLQVCCKKLNPLLHATFRDELSTHAAQDTVTDVASLLTDTTGDSTLLHWAIEEDAWLLAEVLLEAGAPVDQECNGTTPLMIGVNIGSEDACRVLIHYGARLSTKYRYANELHKALTDDKKAISALLLRLTDDMSPLTSLKLSYLHLAAKQGYASLAQHMIAKGAQVDLQSNRGSTPLHLAVKKRSPETIAVLIANGADVDIPDDSGNTPLHLAVKDAHWGSICLLLDTGANPAIQNDSGQTALHCACTTGDKTIANLIVLHTIAYSKRFIGRVGAALQLSTPAQRAYYRQCYQEYTDRFVTMLNTEDIHGRLPYAYYRDPLLKANHAKETLKRLELQIQDPFALAKIYGNVGLSQTKINVQRDKLAIKVVL